MTAFHTISIPHDDILQGRLTMDVFTADLWEVYKGRRTEEYRNSGLFFQCRSSRGEATGNLPFYNPRILHRQLRPVLDGFLTRRDRVQQEVEKVGAQGRLWE